MNNDQDTLLNTVLGTNKNLTTGQIKTTNVNILLNRVRLSRKKDFKKKILFSSLLIALVSLITFFLII